MEPTGEEKDTVQAKGEDDKFKKPPCPYERTTTKGTNKYYFIKTCLKCNLVLERVKKESVAADTAAEGTRQQEKVPAQEREPLRDQLTCLEVVLQGLWPATGRPPT